MIAQILTLFLPQVKPQSQMVSTEAQKVFPGKLSELLDASNVRRLWALLIKPLRIQQTDPRNPRTQENEVVFQLRLNGSVGDVRLDNFEQTR